MHASRVSTSRLVIGAAILVGVIALVSPGVRQWVGGIVSMGTGDATQGYCCAAPESGQACTQVTLGQCHNTENAEFVPGVTAADKDTCDYDVCGKPGYCCVPDSPGAGQPGPGGCLQVTKDQCALAQGATWNAANQAQCIQQAAQNCGAPVAVCGNRIIEGTEQCDDGNTRNLDGCDSKCKKEIGWLCREVPLNSVSSQGGGGASSQNSSTGNNRCPPTHPRCDGRTAGTASCPSGQSVVWALDEGVAGFQSCITPSGAAGGDCYRCAAGGASSAGAASSAGGGQASSWNGQCTDSDNGQDVTVKAVGDSGYGPERCANEYAVLENTCAGWPNYDYPQLYIPCPAGRRCQDGACISAPGQNPAVNCTETDGGFAPGIAGTTTVTGDPSTQDACANNTFMNEWYCTGNSVPPGGSNAWLVSLNCPTGAQCSNGACTFYP